MFEDYEKSICTFWKKCIFNTSPFNVVSLRFLPAMKISSFDIPTGSNWDEDKLEDHSFKTSAFFKGGGVKTLPNLLMDNSKKLPTVGGRVKNYVKFVDVLNGWSLEGTLFWDWNFFEWLHYLTSRHKLVSWINERSYYKPDIVHYIIRGRP